MGYNILGLQSAEGREILLLHQKPFSNPHTRNSWRQGIKCRTMINGGKKHGKRERLSNFPKPFSRAAWSRQKCRSILDQQIIPRRNPEDKGLTLCLLSVLYHLASVIAQFAGCIWQLKKYCCKIGERKEGGAGRPDCSTQDLL